MTLRSIDAQANDVAIQRIRETFDELAIALGVTGVTTEYHLYLDIPEDLTAKEAGGKEGDRWYGITEEGVETVAVLHAMGWILFGRDGSIAPPDGVDGPEELDTLPMDERYDAWYAFLVEYVKASDMPDKIQIPLDDEIDVEAGFGDADIDGTPLDPVDE